MRPVGGIILHVDTCTCISIHCPEKRRYMYVSDCKCLRCFSPCIHSLGNVVYVLFLRFQLAWVCTIICIFIMLCTMLCVATQPACCPGLLCPRSRSGSVPGSRGRLSWRHRETVNRCHRIIPRGSHYYQDYLQGLSLLLRLSPGALIITRIPIPRGSHYYQDPYLQGLSLLLGSPSCYGKIFFATCIGTSRGTSHGRLLNILAVSDNINMYIHPTSNAQPNRMDRYDDEYHMCALNIFHAVERVGI